MKKIFFRVYKIKNLVINLVIVLMLGLVSVVAFLGGGSDPVSVKQSAYYYGDKTGKNVSLMINVYWGDEYLDEMLNILQENQVNATFFIGGIWALDNQDRIKRMLDNGHEIANHGYKHKDQDKLSKENAIKEISTTHDIIFKMTGVEMNLFAPPSGAYNEQTVEIAKSLNYKVIMWSKDTIDWRDQNADLIYSRAVKNLSGGDLILMHPTKETVKALPKIIQTISQRGLSCSTVSKCLGVI